MENICSNCQSANPLAAKFCASCGTPLLRQCALCGGRNPTGSTFCIDCGHRLEWPASSPSAPTAGTPAAYTPPYLTQQMLTSRSAAEGEHKQVTVLFCDIADSSALAQRLDPEAMHRLMDQVLQLMAAAVHRYEGTVNQYLGDAIMALFGAPVALEEHAFRAVQAALTIRETINGYNTQLPHEQGVEIRVRLGLNTGQVVVGSIGDALRRDYTAAGNTTHVAARLQSLAKPGTILITEATHRLVANHIRSDRIGPVEVKGQLEPVVLYRVNGRRRWRSRMEIEAEQGLTQFVGRQRELAWLHQCLERAEAGTGQVVGISGEPGLGKSRLLHEFHTSLAGGRVTWLIGYCTGHGRMTPYLPLLDLLHTNFQIEESDNPLQIREKLRQGILRLDPQLEDLLPYLEALFSLPGTEELLQHLSPKDRRQKTFEAMRTMTVTACRHRTQVVNIENLHWIDQISEDYLAFIVDSLPTIPLLLLTTHRPGYGVRWADKPYYTQIDLDLLGERDTEAMMAYLLGTRNLPADLLPLVQQKVEGNPLFIEEVLRSLLERSILVRHSEGFRWASRRTIEFPATGQDIMRARIDRLDEHVKQTVQTAAVIGREFSLRLLNRLPDMPSETQQALTTLKQLELIYEKRVFPQPEYLFKHAVIQDVAYHSLLTTRRQQLHGAIAQAIEEMYAGRLDEHVAILAHHYARSPYQDRAIAYALQAGDQAAHLYASVEATTYYTQALDLVRALPASHETQRAEIDAILKLATVAATRHDIERDEQNLEHAHTVAHAIRDEPRLAQVLYWRGRLCYVRGEPATALTHAERSLEIADRLGNDALAALPVNLMGRLYFLRSDFVNASQMLARSVEQMRQLHNISEEATAAAFAAAAFGFLGEFDHALPYAEHGVQLALSTQNPFAEAAAYQYRGNFHNQRGNWMQAMADFAAARQLAEQVEDLFRVYIVKLFEGRAHTMAGDPKRGRTLLEESLDLARQFDTKYILAWGKTYLADALLALGEAEAVPLLCQEAISLAEDTGDTFPKALADRTLAQALARLKPTAPQPAETAILEAIRLQQEMAAKPELARSYACYADLLQGWQEPQRARECLMQAMGMFRQMGMTWDLARAEQALQGALQKS